MASSVYAYTRIYLIPDYVSSGKKITVSDISRIEGNDFSSISGLVVPEAFYADGIVDRKEIQKLISSTLSSGYFIMGNGVRVRQKSSADRADRELKKIVLRKGQSVRITIQNRAVRISVRGRVLSDGAKGERVPVHTGSGRKVMGRIINDRQVVVDL